MIIPQVIDFTLAAVCFTSTAGLTLSFQIAVVVIKRLLHQKAAAVQ